MRRTSPRSYSSGQPMGSQNGVGWVVLVAPRRIRDYYACDQFVRSASDVNVYPSFVEFRQKSGELRQLREENPVRSRE